MSKAISKNILLINIEDSMVEVFLVDKNKKNKVICHDVQFFIQKDVDRPFVSRIVFTLEKALQKALENIHKKHKKVDFISISLSSLWCLSRGRNVKYHKNNTFFNLKEKDFKKFVWQEVLDLKSELLEDKYHKLKIIEEKVLGFRINGYKKMFLEDEEKVSELEASIFITFIDEDIFYHISRSIDKFYPHTKHSFNSTILMKFLDIEMNYKHERSYSLMRVTNESLDLLNIKDGFIEYYYSFPVGAGHFVRKFSDFMGMNYDLSFSHLKNFTNNHITEKEKEVVHKFLVGYKRDVRAIFKKVNINKTTFFDSIDSFSFNLFRSIFPEVDFLEEKKDGGALHLDVLKLYLE